jgi:hypothetical protein
MVDLAAAIIASNISGYKSVIDQPFQALLKKVGFAGQLQGI